MVDALNKGIGWTFLTNHAHVLLCLARSPGARMRDLAALVGVTERSVRRIIAELADEGYIEKLRYGRANEYVVHWEKPLKHPIERHRRTGDLVRLIHDAGASAAEPMGERGNRSEALDTDRRAP